MTRHTCQGCQAPIAKEDRRRKNPLCAVGNSKIEKNEGEAPRIKCGRCGKVTVLIKGSVT